MRGWALGLVGFASVISTGCITSFKHPLGPLKDAFIEPRLIGQWTCRSADDGSPGELRFKDFDGRQYYLKMTEEGKDEPDEMRAFATRLGESTFLNLRELGGKADVEWTFLEYSVGEDGVLSLRLVDPEPFEDVLDDPTAVRERLSERLGEPDSRIDWLSCRRVEKPAPPAG